MTSHAAISIVIPVLNGRHTLPHVLAAVVSECRDRRFEILAVDDGSTDGSAEYLRAQEHAGVLRMLTGPRRGPAAAMNLGIRHARFPFICQIDQDVILCPGWVERLLAILADPDLAAAQGRYTVSPHAGFWARVMGRDLDQRYDRIRSLYVDHVCTGNTIYRAAALHQVGLFDETFGYGADNDLSYRLSDAGCRLAFCPSACSVHLWRETWRSYLRQQYGVGYGRLDLVRKHPRRVRGDDVSGAGMIAHAAGMSAIVALAIAAAVLFPLGLDAVAPAAAAAALAALLAVERLVAGIACWRRTGDLVPLAFPVAHLLRDLAWAGAVIAWTARQLTGQPRSAGHSMSLSTATGRASPPPLPRPHVRAPLVLVPAHNEAGSLRYVIAEIRQAQPPLEVLVVDDGSDDETDEILDELEVRHVTLPWRTGVGGAIRAGIRYALRQGYDCVIRMDGDGQHRASDLIRMLDPVLAGRADAVVGSRFLDRARGAGGRRLLAMILSAITRRRITDPTSGYWVFGPRALALLGRRHPAGYAEPELLLLLHRNGLAIEEVPIQARRRIAGQTTLTWPRAALALARTVLALFIVPLRPPETPSEQRCD